MVDGLLAMMETSPEVSGTVNLGKPEEVTVRQLAFMITEIVGCGAGFVGHPLPEDDPLQRRPDITLAAQALRWAPHTSLHTGLTETVDWFWARYAGPLAGAP